MSDIIKSPLPTAWMAKIKIELSGGENDALRLGSLFHQRQARRGGLSRRYFCRGYRQVSRYKHCRVVQSYPRHHLGIAAAAFFNDDYKQFDFSSSFDFATMFGWSDAIPQLTVDVINLTDEEQRQYFQFENATFTQYEPGRTVIVGLRGKF